MQAQPPEPEEDSPAEDLPLPACAENVEKTSVCRGLEHLGHSICAPCDITMCSKRALHSWQTYSYMGIRVSLAKYHSSRPGA